MIGRGVILSEASALTALAESIGEDFEAACRFLDKPSGKIIVTGMGKAGLIGRKIAATFQSTGSPAAFLHPGEAAHGDMGMISDHDTLLALSNSGETDEVLHVARYCRDRPSRVLIIAITSNPASPLAQIASRSIILPPMPEGCPIGRVPMASTAMMLAIGDAIAAELMVRKGFTEAEFLTLHHGGYLGRAMRAVA